MFFGESPISLLLSLLLSSFVNCYVYMIVRSSLKTTIYMKYIVYILLFFSCLGYSTNIQIYRNRRWLEQSPDIQYSERCSGLYVVSYK